jgi:hypothetical protein
LCHPANREVHLSDKSFKGAHTATLAHLAEDAAGVGNQYPGKQRNPQRFENVGCKGCGRTDDCNFAAIPACLQERLQGGVDERCCRNYGNAA